MAQHAETQRLLDVVVASQEAQTMKRPTPGSSANDLSVEREWDGHLLQCCGGCDSHGWSAFASTLFCFPCTVVHNMKAALPHMKWGGLVALLILACSLDALYRIQGGYMMSVCQPSDSRSPFPKPHGPDHMEPKGMMEPNKEKTVLAGATFNPEFLEDLKDPKNTEVVEENGGFVILVHGKTMSEFEKTNAQIQLAKNQAMEGTNQQLLGRKLLHKHHDDDDDDDAKHKKEKKAKKDKKSKKDKKDGHDKHHDADKMHAKTLEHRHTEHDGPRPDPDCEGAQLYVFSLYVAKTISWVLFILTGWRMRIRIRERFNIRGSPIKDFCAWWCCHLCAVCQETRTLTKNKVKNGIWGTQTVFVAPELATPPSMNDAKVPSGKLVEV